ncbi:hypothetical protein WHT83_18300 [Aminobacter sp. P9b]|uniref:hypothetical protein n=1 Tax=Aminobacter sp. P9b TaxID=3133697 RepID=UPI003254A558
MKRGLVGAAALAASVFGADISATSYIFDSAGLAALAQDASSGSTDLSKPVTAPGGFGNGSVIALSAAVILAVTSPRFSIS